MPTLKRETFPDFTACNEVRVPYPGPCPGCGRSGSPAAEDAVDAINDVAEVRCDAQEGQA
ncbi:MAG: hypothetical protein R3F37_10505 [Candidatus Competibacteraceae bacterium]